jgi:hypothetical protein
MFRRYDGMFWVLRVAGVLLALAGAALWLRDATVPAYLREMVHPLRGAVLLGAGVSVFLTGVFGGLLTAIAENLHALLNATESENARRR